MGCNTQNLPQKVSDGKGSLCALSSMYLYNWSMRQILSSKEFINPQSQQFDFICEYNFGIFIVYLHYD